MGIRYLYIDALCISQDDGQDVGAQIPQMKGIYTNETFVLAADSLSDPNQSFSQPRHGYQAHICDFPALVDGNPETLILRYLAEYSKDEMPQAGKHQLYIEINQQDGAPYSSMRSHIGGRSPPEMRAIFRFRAGADRDDFEPRKSSMLYLYLGHTTKFSRDYTLYVGMAAHQAVSSHCFYLVLDSVGNGRFERLGLVHHRELGHDPDLLHAD